MSNDHYMRKVMNTEKNTNEKRVDPTGQNPLIKKTAIYGAVLLVVFALGFVPMWLTARERSANLADAQRQIRSAEIQNTLASSVIDARRGEYEPARQSASDFFTNLQGETERETDSVLTDAQRESVKPLFTQRDEIITLLSRSDPASAERLSDIYVLYRNAMGGS